MLQRYLIPVTLFALLAVAGCRPQADDLVIYSGRSQALVEPLIEQFRQETGLRIGVRYGDTAQLAVGLIEEGERTSADIFWAQDGGALGALELEGQLAELPDSLLNVVEPMYRSETGQWVATSGRARTLAYSPERVDTTALPQSIFDLTDARFENRVGWAPTNGSFQAHVTAMRTLVGDDSTRAWLEAMRENGARSYPRNSAIIQAVADGEIDFGLPNHYYLHRFKADDPAFPVEQTFFAPGDPGNLVNVAGVGLLRASERREAALRFIDFVLSEEAQAYFVNETYEYPVVPEAEAAAALPDENRLQQLGPDVDLNDLRDLERTLQMFREVGIL